MKVLLATPTTQGTVTTAYAHTLVAAISVLADLKATHRLMIVDSADVVTARTIVAHSFMEDTELTHVLFIDSDMAVERAVIEHLFSLKVPIVGTVYPERRLNLDLYSRALSEHGDQARAQALASRFNLRLSPGTKQVTQGVMEVEGFGFGLVLIARSVFQALIDKKIVKPMVSPKLKDAGLTGAIFDFFEEMWLSDGEKLAEDFAFCERVRALGTVPLVAYVGAGMGHVGQFTYNAVFLDRLKAGNL